jgi:hypothetical protein
MQEDEVLSLLASLVQKYKLPPSPPSHVSSPHCRSACRRESLRRNRAQTLQWRQGPAPARVGGGVLLLYCCCTAAFLLLYCCVFAAFLLRYCCVTAALLLRYCCITSEQTLQRRQGTAPARVGGRVWRWRTRKIHGGGGTTKGSRMIRGCRVYRGEHCGGRMQVALLVQEYLITSTEVQILTQLCCRGVCE